MSQDDEDKPTVVLDLNAIKKQKQEQEEDLFNIAQELEFAVGKDEDTFHPEESEVFAEKFLSKRNELPESSEDNVKVILFDFQSNFFKKSLALLPQGYTYHVATSVEELNKFLAMKDFQVCVFNYDVNSRAVNQLTTQIRKKFPLTKTIIVASNISPKKARIHAQTPSGADSYYQLPIEAEKIADTFKEVLEVIEKAS